MEPIIIYIIIGVAALALGLGLGKVIFAKNTQKKIEEAEQQAQKSSPTARPRLKPQKGKITGSQGEIRAAES